MAKKLFVGNLSWNIKDEQLNEMFAEVGTVVSASVITDRATGRSKGFAFVEMSTDEEADKAIETLNGKEVDGRAISVSEARPPKPREERGGYNGGGNSRGNW